ncbi:MAG TPA: hypothetical protein PLA84_03745 [Petrotogaceae bacterium]|nr:hypothetical protein [Petrotogaceae bacterium]HQH32617.1 hypothetical protein [Petrotogaceae bacterium]
MRKFFLVFIFIFVSIPVFSLEIRDLKPSSPYYSQVVRMVTDGLLELDSQGRFNGSSNVMRFDIAFFGANLIDYLDKKYSSSFDDFEKRISQIDTESLENRINNIETTLYNYDSKIISMEKKIDSKISGLNSDIAQQKSRVEALEKFMNIDGPLDTDSAIFKVILDNAAAIANDTAKKTADSYLKTLMSFSEQSNKKVDLFQSELLRIEEKLDKTTDSISFLFAQYEEKNRQQLNDYAKQRLDSEMEGIKVALRNIVNSHIGFYNQTAEATLSALRDRIAALEYSGQNQYEKRFNDIISRLAYLESKETVSTFQSTVQNDTELLIIKKDIESLANDIKDNKTLYDKLNNRVEYINAFIDTYDNRNEYFTRKLSELESKNSDVNSFVGELRQMLENIKATSNQSIPSSITDYVLKNDFVNLQQEVRLMQEYINMYSDKLSQLYIYTIKANEYDEKFKISEKTQSAQNESIQKLSLRTDSVESQINSLSSLIKLDKDTLNTIGNVASIAKRVGESEKKLEDLSSLVYENQNKLELIYNSDLLKQSNSLVSEINKNEIQKLKEDYDFLVKSYILLKNQTVSPETTKIAETVDLSSMKTEIKRELSSDLASELIKLQSDMSDIKKTVFSLSTKYNEINAEKASKKEVADIELSVQKVTASSELSLKVTEMEKQISELQKPNQDIFWSSTISGVLGVAVGALITYFLLSPSL